jgi:hypothetical protein
MITSRRMINIKESKIFRSNGDYQRITIKKNELRKIAATL